MLIYLSFSLEAGCEQEHPVVNEEQRKPARCLNIQLLRWDKLAPLGVPLVDLCQRVVAAKDGVLPVADRDGLEYHRAAGGECLDLFEHGAVPAHHLGVPDESCQAYKQLTFKKEKVLKGFFPLPYDTTHSASKCGVCYVMIYRQPLQQCAVKPLLITFEMRLLGKQSEEEPKSNCCETRGERF